MTEVVIAAGITDEVPAWSANQGIALTVER